MLLLLLPHSTCDRSVTISVYLYTHIDDAVRDECLYSECRDYFHVFYNRNTHTHTHTTNHRHICIFTKLTKGYVVDSPKIRNVILRVNENLEC